MPVLDINRRGEKDRQFRRSFDTFTPMGPAIVTAAEVREPGSVHIRRTVNGAARQHAHARDLIYRVVRLVEFYSGATTLQPGNVIATGTPEDVGRTPGDGIALTIDLVGELIMPVMR